MFVPVLGLSLVAASGVCSPLGMCGLLIVEASLLAEHRLSVGGLQQLQHTGLVVVAHRLSCPVTCGIFPDKG